MRLLQALRTAARLLVLDAKSWAIVRWVLRRGDRTLRLDYALTPASVVFDVGGYRGDWAAAMVERYGCKVHVFEPVEEFRAQIERRLGANPNVVINGFGLAGRTTTCLISVEEDSSSVARGEAKREIQLVDVDEYVRRHGIDRVDLIKINIEGGEYELLERMHETGLIPRCVDLQIQFHDFVPGAQARRDALRSMLAATHRLTYDYPFIWENWHLGRRA